MLSELSGDCIMLIMEFIFYVPKSRRCIAQTSKGKMCSRKRKRCLFCKQHYMCLITDTIQCRVLLRTLIKRARHEKVLNNFRRNLYTMYKKYNQYNQEEKLIDNNILTLPTNKYSNENNVNEINEDEQKENFI